MIGRKKLVGPLERRLGQQMVQVLEEVHAWDKGKQSAEHVSLEPRCWRRLTVLTPRLSSSSVDLGEPR
jgi:hypothetical protein